MEYQKQIMKENMNYETGDTTETYVLTSILGGL